MRCKRHGRTGEKAPLLEDARNHSPEQLAELRLLLSSDAPSRPDPERRGFFEVDGHSHVFYILKYPSGSKILLLAIWEHNRGSEHADACEYREKKNGRTNLGPVIVASEQSWI